jgi:hypothetical protein
MKMIETGLDISKEIGELRENITEKPCIELGYCPYGPLVEDFPLPSISRCEAIEHNEYLKKRLKQGDFDNGTLMTREMAEKNIAEFNENDYPEESDSDEWGVCGVFGHYCPVMFVSEPFIDEDDE